jgi:hypothetical protein
VSWREFLRKQAAGILDEIFRSEGIRVIRAPIAAPRGKAHAERWVGACGASVSIGS